MGKKRICVIGGCQQALATNNNSSICHKHRHEGATIYFIFGGPSDEVEIVYDKDLSQMEKEYKSPAVAMSCWVDGGDLMAIIGAAEILKIHEKKQLKKFDEEDWAVSSVPSAHTLLALIPSLLWQINNLRQAEQAMISE